MSEKQPIREILKSRGQLDRDVIGLRAGDQVFDLHTPIDPSTEGTPIHATDPQGLQIIRHSSAHVMADAVQGLFPGTKVTFGPAIEDGFYYDFAKPDGAFTEDDLAKIEARMREIIAKDAPFRREVVSRDEAVKLFEAMGENFKVEHIHNIPADEEISLYRHGVPGSQWVDLCHGPHVPSTGFLKAIKLTSLAGAYWRGDERNPMLQRIYGTAFPSQAALEAHLKRIEEAKARDHRKLGKELDLFLFDERAPAMPFFLPRGAAVYNGLVGYVRGLYDREGYEEVITPQVFSPALFRTSGHLDNYNENMYRPLTEDHLEPFRQGERPMPELLDYITKDSAALKPMNCPSHCVIFGSRRRSYRELPWRVADFGRLHRYERGGVVHGLSRVRTFCQDDAHIFCQASQVADEIARFIRLIGEVYRAFQFERVDVKLATRPERRLGSDAQWDQWEGVLEQGLKQADLPFEFSPGDAVFYGPKIEFHVLDALKRSWQLGTIQYDANLPNRFDLTYKGEDGKDHRPVMLHRAMLGSLERFFAVYLEHCGGNFPTWLAPKQAIVLTVTNKVDPYAQEALSALRDAGLRVDADLSSDKLGAKIRNARLLRYPYLCVVGAKEAEVRGLGVRSRDRGELGTLSLGDFIEMVKLESQPPAAASTQVAPGTSA